MRLFKKKPEKIALTEFNAPKKSDEGVIKPLIEHNGRMSVRSLGFLVVIHIMMMSVF